MLGTLHETNSSDSCKSFAWTENRRLILLTLWENEIPSAFEKSFGRPRDQLAFLEYHFGHSIDTHTRSNGAHSNVCEQVPLANQRKQPVLSMMNSVHPVNQKLFALSLVP
jgi:hypothetical protein